MNVVSGETADLGKILLSLSKGPEGKIVINDTVDATVASVAAKISLARAVVASLSYDSDAVLMKISDEPSFLNKSWGNVAKTANWTFGSDGRKVGPGANQLLVPLEVVRPDRGNC